jgi:hypothetical protein
MPVLKMRLRFCLESNPESRFRLRSTCRPLVATQCYVETRERPLLPVLRCLCLSLKETGVADAVIKAVEQIRKRHPELSEGECYSRLFSEHPEFYEAYVTTTSIVSRNGDGE